MFAKVSLLPDPFDKCVFRCSRILNLLLRQRAVDRAEQVLSINADEY